MLNFIELDYKKVKLCFELDSDSIRLWSQNQWESEFRKKGVKIFALLLTNKIIGVCALQVIIDEAQINYFSINQKFRRKGYGRYLMSNLINQCEELNLKKILLEVSENNFVAQKFYSNFEFLNVGRRKKYYQDGSDALLKEKIFLI